MKNFFTTPFVLITTFFVVAAAASAIIYFKPFELRTIEQRNLSAVRDLKGTWEGRAPFTIPECIYNDAITLIIDNQSGNSISGSFTVSHLSSTARININCGSDGKGTFPMNANIEGTRIVNLQVGEYGTFSGSYTQDTITLNQTSPASDGGSFATINLLRK